MYDLGYSSMLEKLGAGMYPTLAELFRMGIRFGSKANLAPLAKGVGPKSTREITKRMRRPSRWIGTEPTAVMQNPLYISGHEPTVLLSRLKELGKLR